MTIENNGESPEHTSFTPPPPSPLPDTESPAASPPASGRERSPGATAILVLTAVFGGIALLATGGTAAAAATASMFVTSGTDSTRTVNADGVERIAVEADASNMVVLFDDVDEAELSIINGRGADWTFEREGDELLVRSPSGAFAGWLSWWPGGWSMEDEFAELTLPNSLAGAELDADLTLNAGSLDVRGDFGVLDLRVSAGTLNVEGSATDVDVEMSAGRADVALADVSTADLGLSAGNLVAQFTGTPPNQTAVDVSAGKVELTLPDVEYEVSQEVSAGTLNAEIDESSRARRTIDVTLSAGTVIILPDR